MPLQPASRHLPSAGGVPPGTPRSRSGTSWKRAPLSPEMSAGHMAPGESMLSGIRYLRGFRVYACLRLVAATGMAIYHYGYYLPVSLVLQLYGSLDSSSSAKRRTSGQEQSAAHFRRTASLLRAFFTFGWFLPAPSGISFRDPAAISFSRSSS